MNIRVFVKLKDGVLDPQGQTILSSIGRMGYDFAKDVKVGRFFDMEVADGTPMDALEKIASDMLANPIIEEYSIVKAD
jgi:phosphoribosylformylglycinamidine synthase